MMVALVDWLHHILNIPVLFFGEFVYVDQIPLALTVRHWPTSDGKINRSFESVLTKAS